MRQSLILHPEARCRAVTQIEVEAVRPNPGNLLLRYVVTGNMNELRMAPAAALVRAEELWRHTCFEAFVCAPPATAYYEFNFAPSRRWAAYQFGSYRTGMSVASEIAAPRFEVLSNGTAFELQAALELDRLPGLPSDGPWRLGLSAVIEDTSGRKSYWALAHPPGSPDFHHSDCFALEIMPANGR